MTIVWFLLRIPFFIFIFSLIYVEKPIGNPNITHNYLNHKKYYCDGLGNFDGSRKCKALILTQVVYR